MTALYVVTKTLFIIIYIIIMLHATHLLWMLQRCGFNLWLGMLLHLHG